MLLFPLRLLFDKKRLQILADPLKGRFEAVITINHPNLRLHPGRLAEAVEELVARVPRLQVRIDRA